MSHLGCTIYGGTHSQAGFLHELKSECLLNLSPRHLTCITLVPALLPWTRVSKNPMEFSKVCELKVKCRQIPKIPNYKIDDLGLSTKSPSCCILFPTGIHNGSCVTEAELQNPLSSASRETLSWLTNWGCPVLDFEILIFTNTKMTYILGSFISITHPKH